MVLVVVKGLPESYPDVEQAEPTTDTAKKTMGHYDLQCRIRKQQSVICPFWSPGQNDQQHSCDRTDQYKQKNGDAMHPELKSIGPTGRIRLHWTCERASLRWKRTILAGLAGIAEGGGIDHSLPLRSLALRFPSDTGTPESRHRLWTGITCRGITVEDNLGAKPIGLFYDFRALMRSATSR